LELTGKLRMSIAMLIGGARLGAGAECRRVAQSRTGLSLLS
jgi:hypothetical protein